MALTRGGSRASNFIGRKHEMAALIAALDNTLSGRAANIRPHVMCPSGSELTLCANNGAVVLVAFEHRKQSRQV